MSTDARCGVTRRALGMGTAIGALTGGLTPAFAVVLTIGWRATGGGLLLGLFGAPAGAIVGLSCALIPSVALAWRRNFFLRHATAARFCSVSVCALLLIVAAMYTAVHWNGNVTYEAIATVPLACGVLLGARSAGYVLNGCPAS